MQPMFIYVNVSLSSDKIVGFICAKQQKRPRGTTSLQNAS